MEALHYRTLILIVACNITACAMEQPPCPNSAANSATANAGCLVLKQQQLLMVIDLSGKLSVPGGSSDGAESPSCTAHRETWEETGLDIQPRELVRVFENGFHLYHCALHDGSGEIDPPLRFEIERALWLAPENFDDYPWRFPDQQQWLEQWIKLDTAKTNP
jgi:8-oxo-dGTP pyrophosphatase MutT (NUDIX family)